MAETSHVPSNLVDLLRRDLTQINMLADLDALNPERLRHLLRSMGELVNAVEVLVEVVRDAQAPVTPEEKRSRFRTLQDEFGIHRMRSVNGLGVIDGGLSS